MIYTVRYNGITLAKFESKIDANQYLLKFMEQQNLAGQRLDYIDAAVLKSDMSEANTLIKHIMEIR
jgi:hypothetical protein